MPWHMLHFSDLQRKPVSDQLFSFADAYLESADSLCAVLCKNADAATYAHGAVIMSLTFHALELFLKAAILRKAPTETFAGRAGHDLINLHKLYTNLYQGEAMQFSVPFKRGLPDTKELDPQIAEELLARVRDQDMNMPEDQLHRYPISAGGKEWEATLGFEPNSFSRTILQLRSELAAVKTRIQGG